MGELGVDRAAGRLAGAAVAAERHHRVAAIDQFLGHRLEPVPLRPDPREHAGQHRLRPAIGIVVGIREILRLVPDDVRAHPAEHARHVAGGEGVVDRADQGDIGLGHGVSPLLVLVMRPWGPRAQGSAIGGREYFRMRARALRPPPPRRRSRGWRRRSPPAMRPPGSRSSPARRRSSSRRMVTARRSIRPCRIAASQRRKLPAPAITPRFSVTRASASSPLSSWKPASQLSPKSTRKLNWPNG